MGDSKTVIPGSAGFYPSGKHLELAKQGLYVLKSTFSFFQNFKD
jgi:hypothetical protein